MGKRFAIAIGVATAGVMALGAQTATAVPKYDTELTINKENGLVYGSVLSDVRKCKVGRRVVLFRQDRGADTRLGMSLSGTSGSWGVRVGRAPEGWRVYAKAKHKVRDQFVCLADRSRTYTVGTKNVAAAGVMALGAQSAAAPNVAKYDTKVTIAVNGEPQGRIYRGQVRSKVTKCMERRRVILFKVRPGPNRVLGWTRTQLWGGPEGDNARFVWSVQALVRTSLHADLYAKVHREEGDGFVCRKVRSRII